MPLQLVCTEKSEETQRIYAGSCLLYGNAPLFFKFLSFFLSIMQIKGTPKRQKPQQQQQR